jgi:D-threo-aldose 1-dehydrogenase
VRQRGAHVVLGGPFNSGFLAGGEHYDYQPAKPEQHQHRERLRQVAARHGVDLAAAALQFGAGASGGGGDDSGRQQSGAPAPQRGLMDMAIPAAFWEELRAEGLVPVQAPLP